MNKEEIEDKLLYVINDLSLQEELHNSLPCEMMSLDDQINQMKEWIIDHGEYGIAYDNIISLLYHYPSALSGNSVVKLIEISITLGVDLKYLNNIIK